MSSATDILIKSLAKTIAEGPSKKPSAYDTSAEVMRVEGNIAWVHIPGGIDETPVQLTTNAKKGDIVQVRVSGGRAWLYGNATAPPTDDTVANKAQKTAVAADEHATSAVTSAMLAQEFAEQAKSDAESASTAAGQAWTKAGEAEAAAQIAQETAEGVEGIAEQAQASAENASEYAARALGNLSTVQNITETLNWITQHGTMTLTSDTALNPTHVYFVADASGDYAVGGVTYAVVTEPDVADIDMYYELSIDESLNNYVGTHLALTSEGLWLLPASTSTNKVLIATGAGSVYTTAGTYIIDSDGTTVLASFRVDGATIGQVVAGKYNTNIDSTGLDIRDNATSVAKFGISARIGEESNGGSKVIISPDNFTLYSKENATVFKAGVDSGGTVDTDINIGNENTNIIIGSTTISNGESSSVSGFANLPALNSVSTNVNFYVQLGTFKRTATGISYITITNFVTFVKGTSNTITDSGITISYDGSDTLTVSGSYINNTGATLTLTDNMVRVRGNTAIITVPLYDTMINGNAMFNVDGGNTIIGLPLKSDSKFDDYDLYNAIESLGWTSDVMVGISLKHSSGTWSVNQKWIPTITTIPKKTPISCVSSDPTIATVYSYDQYGQPILKALAVGSCIFTYSITVAGKVYTATYNVTVTQ